MTSRLVSPPTGKVEFYVSPNGNDTWSGTLPEANTTKTDGPFATFEAARDAVRRLKLMADLPAGSGKGWRWPAAC